MVGWLMFSHVFIFNHHSSKWPISPLKLPGSTNTFTFLEVPLVSGAPRAPGAGGVCRVVTGWTRSVVLSLTLENRSWSPQTDLPRIWTARPDRVANRDHSWTDQGWSCGGCSWPWWKEKLRLDYKWIKQDGNYTRKKFTLHSRSYQDLGSCR